MSITGFSTLTRIGRAINGIQMFIVRALSCHLRPGRFYTGRFR